MSILFAILLVLIFCLWPAVAAMSTSLHGSDPAGNAMSQAFAMLAGIGLWVLLAILLLIAGLGGEMPGWLAVAALVLTPASGVAAQVALQVMTKDRDLRWPIIVPAAAPPLLVAFALWSFVPFIHSTIPATTAGPFCLGMILVLSLLPWPVRWSQARADAAIPRKTPEQLAQEEARQKEEARQQRRESFRKLTPDSDLWEWLDFTNDDEFRQRAYEGLKHVKARQEQVPKVLRPGQRWIFMALPDLDLKMTPELSDAVHAFLIDQVTNLRPYDPQHPMETRVVTEWFEQYFPIFRWLIAQGRDCDAELAEIEKAVCKYPDSPERQSFVESLKKFRQKK